MISTDDLRALVRAHLPDAEVEIVDRTGTLDHFDLFVCSAAFTGRTLLDRHRLVENALREARADGRIHALAIRTDVPQGVSHG